MGQVRPGAVVGTLAVAVLAVGCTGDGEPAPPVERAVSTGGGAVLSGSEVAQRYGYDPAADDLTPVYALVPE